MISFSPHYLLDGLAAAAALAAPARQAAAPRDGDEAPPPGPDQIRLEFSTPAKPALITWAGDEGLAPGDPAARVPLPGRPAPDPSPRLRQPRVPGRLRHAGKGGVAKGEERLSGREDA